MKRSFSSLYLPSLLPSFTISFLSFFYIMSAYKRSLQLAYENNLSSIGLESWIMRFYHIYYLLYHLLYHLHLQLSNLCQIFLAISCIYLKRKNFPRKEACHIMMRLVERLWDDMVDCETKYRWDGWLWDRYDHDEVVDFEMENEMVDCEDEKSNSLSSSK